MPEICKSAPYCDCEYGHELVSSVTECEYYKNEPYPHLIECEMEDGALVKYIKVEE